MILIDISTFFFFRSFLFSISTIIFTGKYTFDLDIPDRLSLRIAYLSIFLLAVILSAAYSASLTSFLTAGISILPFDSLESFVEDGTYKLSVFRGTAEYDIFAVSMTLKINVVPTNDNIFFFFL